MMTFHKLHQNDNMFYIILCYIMVYKSINVPILIFFNSHFPTFAPDSLRYGTPSRLLQTLVRRRVSLGVVAAHAEEDFLQRRHRDAEQLHAVAWRTRRGWDGGMGDGPKMALKWLESQLIRIRNHCCTKIVAGLHPDGPSLSTSSYSVSAHPRLVAAAAPGTQRALGSRCSLRRACDRWAPSLTTGRWSQVPRRGFSQCSTLSGTDSMWEFESDSNLFCHLELPLIQTTMVECFFLFLAMSFLAKFPCVFAISLNRFSSVLICVGSTSIL